MICVCGGKMFYDGQFDHRVPQQHIWRCPHCKANKIEVREREEMKH